MPELVENARAALAEAHQTDEVKDIHDGAEAARLYAKQARDSELIDHATEITMRAEVSRPLPRLHWSKDRLAPRSRKSSIS
jgi:hypothetical protein